MKNADKPAMGQNVRISPNHTHIFVGLTKRELAAFMAMQGLLSNSAHLKAVTNIAGDNRGQLVTLTTVLAFAHADAMLEES